MPCCTGPRECNDFDDEREGVSDQDIARFDREGGDEVVCPECGAEFYHEAPLCPKCGHAMMAGEGRRASKPEMPGWIVPCAVALVIAGIALCCAKYMF